MMNIDEDIYELHSRIVQASGYDQMKWRRFHVACYKHIVGVLPDIRQRKIILFAEDYTKGVASPDIQKFVPVAEIEVERAWKKVDSLKIKNDDWDALWPVSAEADEAWCDYLGWLCTKLACSPTLDEFSTPEPAASLLAWNGARRKCIDEGIEVNRQNVKAIWQRIHSEAEAAQRLLFLQLYGLI